MTKPKRSYSNDSFLAKHVAAADAAPPTVQFNIAKIGRRRFLKVTGIAGGGLLLAVGTGSGWRGNAAATAKIDGTFTPNAYVKIADGQIVIYAPNPEIGQGVKTSLPMIVAEELDAAWPDVRVEQARIDKDAYGGQVAGGSRSIPQSWDGLRRAGAVARAMLVSAAAAQWGVKDSECQTRNSTITHSASGRSVSYFDVANAAARLPVPDAAKIPLKSRNDYRLLGTRISGVDNHAIVTGAPLFGIDQVLPNMRYAVYQKCPATGGSVASANLEEIKKLPGVLDAFVLDGNGAANGLMPGVAIVANGTWAAISAKKQLKVKWNESGAAKDSWTAAVAQADKLAKGPGPVINNKGDVDAQFSAAAATAESTYRYAFVSHAQLEPQNCTAWFRDGAIELWAPTQTPQQGAEIVASLLSIPKTKVTVHQTRCGGGFGRRLTNDYMAEAAAIAKRVGAPVKLQWTREDDMAHDFYRAGGFHTIKGAVDKAGKLSAWQHHFVTFANDKGEAVVGGQMSDKVFPGELVANYKLMQSNLSWDTPCGAWRAPGSNVFGFVVQSFLDEMATAAHRDPVEFLLDVLGEPRWMAPGDNWRLNTGRAAAVVKLAAEKAGWGKAMPAGRGLGIAFYFSHAGHFAEVADVSVTPDKKITVHRVTVVGDVGPIVNRSMAENQCEGSVIDGLSTMMGLKVTFEDGRAQQQNFNEYPMLRMPNTPEVDVYFIDSDYAPTGLGEPALPPLAAAVCNAIHAASGQRPRTMPISEEGFSI